MDKLFSNDDCIEKEQNFGNFPALSPYNGKGVAGNNQSAAPEKGIMARLFRQAFHKCHWQYGHQSRQGPEHRRYRVSDGVM